MKLTKTKRKELRPGDMFCIPYKRGVSEVYIVLRDDLIDSLSNAEVLRIEPDDSKKAQVAQGGNKMARKIIGYRFGGTEEPYIVPITESDDPVEATKQKQYIKSFPGAGQVVDWLRTLEIEDAMPAKTADIVIRDIRILTARVSEAETTASPTEAVALQEARGHLRRASTAVERAQKCRR